jgi:hypothetical protein
MKKKCSQPSEFSRHQFQATYHIIKWIKCYMPIIPTTKELEIRRITVQSQPGQKISETPSPPISQVWWYNK